MEVTNREYFDAVMDRLRAKLNVSSDADLAAALGMGPNAFSNRKKSASVPYEKIIDIADDRRLDLGWVFAPAGSQKVESRQDQPDSASHYQPLHVESPVTAEQHVLGRYSDFVMVPRYEVRASAGHGAVIHSEQIVDYLAFRAEWVHNALGVAERDLALIEVHGDSMEPTLSNGDLILLDMRHSKVMDNSVYAIQLNGGLLVKRIQVRLNGSIIVKSDNPRYEPESLESGEADQLRVVGRVVWAGRRM